MTKEVKIKKASIEDIKLCEGLNLDSLSEPTEKESEFYRTLDQHRTDYLEILVDEQRTLLDERVKYAYNIYRIVIGWLISVLIILLAQSFDMPPLAKLISFHMDDSVLITLLSGTTATVLALFTIVAKWLFPSTDKS